MANNKSTKKTNVIILVVVLGLVILFGVGQFFAYSNLNSGNSNASSSTATTPQGPAPTQVIAYEPPLVTSSTPVQSGSCWTSSIAAPYRSDAWRCAVGNGIQDPCFQLQGSTSTLMCGIDPTNPNDTSTFALKLTQPLPAPEVLPGVVPTNWAWLIELQDGTLCSPFTGTLPPVEENGQTAAYDCAPGPLGQDLVVFGNPNTSSSVWTANVGTLSTSTKIFPPVIVSSSTVPIETVWQ